MGLSKLPELRFALALVILFLSCLVGYNFPRTYVAFGLVIALVVVSTIYVYFDRYYNGRSPLLTRLYNYAAPIKVLYLEVMISGDFFSYDGYEYLPAVVAFLAKSSVAIMLIFPVVLLITSQPLSVVLFAFYAVFANCFTLVFYDNILQPIMFLVFGYAFYLDSSVRKHVSPSNVVLSFSVPTIYYTTVVGMYYAENNLQLALCLIPCAFVILVTYLISYYDEMRAE